MDRNSRHHVSGRAQGPTRCVLVTMLLLTHLQAVVSQAVCRSNGGRCGCTSDNNINCDNLQPPLTKVPSGLPEDTAVLNVQGNSISVLRKGDLRNLEMTRTIFLQENALVAIEAGAFDNLFNLQLLVMSHNNLTVVYNYWFQHLPNIQTIDLSHNKIRSIQKKAFYSLPSSKTHPQVTVELGGNIIQCGCSEKALWDWSRNLDSTVSQLQLNGFQCRFRDGREIGSLTDQDFSGCSNSQLTIFPSRQTCESCRNAHTQSVCDKSSVNLCGGAEGVCQTEVQIIQGTMSINKQCGAYTDCMLRARNNHDRCNVTRSAGSVDTLYCTFCCSGSNCNEGDMGGRTVSYKIYVGLLEDITFQPYMLNAQDARYINKAVTYTQTLNNIFKRQLDGGYDTTFLSFRDETPFTYVSSMVDVTVLSTQSLGEIIRDMLRAINISLMEGTISQTKHVYVGTELSTTQRCQQEATMTAVGIITWPETSVSSTANMACPRNVDSMQTETSKYARRQCILDSNGVAQWQNPDVRACQQSPTTGKLEELNNTVITPNNVNMVLTQLNSITQEGSNLTAMEVTLAVDTVDKALTQGGALNSIDAMDDAVQVLSHLLDAQPQVLVTADRMKRSSTRLLKAADVMAEEGRLVNGKLLLSSPNLVVAGQAVDRGNFQGLTVTASSDNMAFQDGDVQVYPESLTPQVNVSSLVVPASVLLSSSSSSSRIAMKALVSDKLFEAIKQSRSTQVSEPENRIRRINSYVLDASVVGQKVRNLKDPVVITLSHLNENSTNPACVFWDEAKLDWSSDGCSVVPGVGNGSSSCQCNHLTNFALLMDVYGQGVSLSETDSKILSIISYIGCGVSLLALLLTLLTYILFKKLRRDNPSKILVNLCVALALSNLVFVAGMHPYALNSAVGCKVVAALLHFSLLASLCWMAVEAFYMYLALVLVFKTYFTNFILKCSIVGWGVPLLIVAITLGVNETDNYGSLGTGVCWLKGLWFYAAFVGPVCLILLINFLAFAMVLRQILGLKNRKLNKTDTFSVSQQLRGTVGVAILLGLTWIFAVFAIDRASVVFYYLFAIFNSLQGLWIFMFYCVLKKEARSAWKRACCKSLDDKSVATTSRGVYSNTAATKTGHARSTTDNGTTTTSSAALNSSSLDSERDSHTYVNINNQHVTPTPTQPSRTVYRSEGNITLPDTSPRSNLTSHTPTPTSKDTDPKSVNISEPDPSSQQPSVELRSQTSSNQDQGNNLQPSPRPLHFRVGHTLSSVSTQSQPESTTSTDDIQLSADDGNVSVAEMIKKMNNTRL